MRIRAALFALVQQIIVRDSLADYQLASILRTSRPRASDLIHGHIQRFNSETLVDILARLGVDVDIVVTRRRGYILWNLTKPRPGWRPSPYLAHD